MKIIEMYYQERKRGFNHQNAIWNVSRTKVSISDKVATPYIIEQELVKIRTTKVLDNIITFDYHNHDYRNQSAEELVKLINDFDEEI